MGGQTARQLAYLLRHGNDRERRRSGDSCSGLFVGGEQRIKSITTIATPHNGTTLVNDITVIDTVIRGAIAAVAAVVENNLFLNLDLKMGHWGVRRNENEPLAQYFDRLRKHKVWNKSQKDFSIYDTSIEGAIALNRVVAAEPDVYYFSWANEATTPGPFGRYAIPEADMLAAFVPSSIFIGSIRGRHDELLDGNWYENDGTINTISMRGPVLGSTDTIVEYDGTPTRGEWNFMGTIHSADHADVLGIPVWRIQEWNGFNSILDIYLYACEIATSLPKGPSSR